VFVQLSLQPKLSRRRYASVSYALQNNTVFRRAQNCCGRYHCLWSYFLVAG